MTGTAPGLVKAQPEWSPQAEGPEPGPSASTSSGVFLAEAVFAPALAGPGGAFHPAVARSPIASARPARPALGTAGSGGRPIPGYQPDRPTAATARPQSGSGRTVGGAACHISAARPVLLGLQCLHLWLWVFGVWSMYFPFGSIMGLLDNSKKHTVGHEPQAVKGVCHVYYIARSRYLHLAGSVFEYDE